MESAPKKSILKIIEDIKSKTLSHEEIIENIEEIGKTGDNSLADDLILLIDEFKDDEEIILALREVLIKLGITPFYMNEAGIAKEDAGDYNSAIRKYELCVKLDPNYHWAWYNMGRMYGNQKKDSEKAIELYKKAVSINENYGDGWNNLGNIYLRLNQLNLAKQAYERSIQCNDYNAKYFPYFNLGLVYDRIEDQKKALENFLKAIEQKSDYSKAIFNAGKTYKKLGDFEKANEYFAKALKYDLSLEPSIRELGVIIEEVMAIELLKNLEDFELDQKLKES